MKIGIDIHGVINIYPEIFQNLTHTWLAKGHEIHIITGKEWKLAELELLPRNISFTHHFSIVDFHRETGTKMNQKSTGWWMDDETWNASKGLYCKSQGISIHFDNELQYAPYFPESCSFVWVRERGFEHLASLFESL